MIDGGGNVSWWREVVLGRIVIVAWLSSCEFMRVGLVIVTVGDRLFSGSG